MNIELHIEKVQSLLEQMDLQKKCKFSAWCCNALLLEKKVKEIMKSKGIKNLELEDKLIENNKAVVYDRKNEKEINYLIKVKYDNAIYYDGGGGSLYNGYNFYTNKELTDLILQSDIITQFGVEIHSSIGDNPYNRELSPEAKKNFGNSKSFSQRKELYQRAMQTPDVTQSFNF